MNGISSGRAVISINALCFCVRRWSTSLASLALSKGNAFGVEVSRVNALWNVLKLDFKLFFI